MALLLILGTGSRVNGQHHAPAVLPQGKSPRCPFNKRMGGLHSQCVLLQKRSVSCSSLASDPRTPSPYPSHYTKYAIPFPNFVFFHNQIKYFNVQFQLSRVSQVALYTCRTYSCSAFVAQCSRHWQSKCKAETFQQLKETKHLTSASRRYTTYQRRRTYMARVSETESGKI
jgi:hypothetical protein